MRAKMKTILFVLPWLFFAGPLYAQGIGMGGFVTQGGEVYEGSLSCTLSFYESEEATTPLCSNDYDIDVAGGTFYTAPDCLTANDLTPELWLEFQCGGEVLYPRVEFHSVPYALRAKVADYALAVDSSASLSLGGTTTITGNLAANNATISPSEVALLDGKTTLIDIDDPDVVRESHLKAVDDPTDEECLTYEATGAAFEWQTCGGVTSDSLDFVDLQDALDLDANLTISQGTYTQTQTYTGAGAAVEVNATGGGVAVKGETTSGAGVRGSATDATGIAGYFVNTVGEALYVNGGLRLKRTAVTCNGTQYEVRPEDYIVACTTLTAATTIKFPAPSTSNIGRQIVIKDETGTANTNDKKITLQADGGALLEGAATQDITTPYGVVVGYSTGTAWVKQ